MKRLQNNKKTKLRSQHFKFELQCIALADEMHLNVGTTNTKALQSLDNLS